MRKSSLAWAMACLLLGLCACGVQQTGNGGLPTNLPATTGKQEAKTEFAESYLDETSEEDILDYFVKAAYVGTGGSFGFSSPEEISPDDLFRFAVLAADPAKEAGWYRESDKTYRIPLADITGILDACFEGYVLKPEDVTYADYRDDEKVFTASALGFGTGATLYYLSEKAVVDGETVRVVIGDEYGPDVTATARVTGSGVKFLSCRLADSSEGADSEIY